MPACGALRDMHAQHRPALGAGPFLVLAPYELANAVGFDAVQVVKRAGGVSGPITVIQVLDLLAGELTALETILELSRLKLLTMHAALESALACEAALRTAARAGIAFPPISAAQPAVDAARCD